MRVPPLLAAIIRTATTTCYLAVQTTSDIVSSARYEWRHHRDRTALPVLLRWLARMVRYYLGCAVDPRTFFPGAADDYELLRTDL